MQKMPDYAKTGRWRSSDMRHAATVCFALLVLTTAFAADIPVNVYVDGTPESYSPAARLRDGTVYVPLRQGADSLGVVCKWQASTNTAQICTDNGCTIIRKREGIVVDGSLFLPLRRMGNALGAKVTWDAAQRAVIIQKP